MFARYDGKGGRKMAWWIDSKWIRPYVCVCIFHLTMAMSKSDASGWETGSPWAESSIFGNWSRITRCASQCTRYDTKLCVNSVILVFGNIFQTQTDTLSYGTRSSSSSAVAVAVAWGERCFCVSFVLFDTRSLVGCCECERVKRHLFRSLSFFAGCFLLHTFTFCTYAHTHSAPVHVYTLKVYIWLLFSLALHTFFISRVGCSFMLCVIQLMLSFSCTVYQLNFRLLVLAYTCVITFHVLITRHS